jgi:hypothetical protein
MNSLTKQLSEITDPKEADVVLSNIWKQFHGTSAHQALEIVLSTFKANADNVVLAPSASSEQRTFHAGQLALLASIQHTLDIAFQFDPTKVEYPSELPTDEDDVPHPKIVY